MGKYWIFKKGKFNYLTDKHNCSLMYIDSGTSEDLGPADRIKSRMYLLCNVVVVRCDSFLYHYSTSLGLDHIKFINVKVSTS